MEVLSFYVTASILALSFDVGPFFFERRCRGWLTEGGEGAKESL